MKIFSSAHAFNASRFGFRRATCITSGMGGGGNGNKPDIHAYLLLHSPKDESKADPNQVEKMDFVEAMKRTLDGEEFECRWSVGNRINIEPGSRVFLYRSGHASPGILGAGRIVLPPQGKGIPGSAVYKGKSWRGGERMTSYVQVRWEMMVDPDQECALIPRERLSNDGRFTPVFTKNGRAWAPQCSGYSIRDIEVAQTLYKWCRDNFNGIRREYGIDPDTAALSGAPFSAWQIDSKERKAIESAAVDAAKAHYRALGYEVESVECENLGWDLNVRKDGEIFRCVEVKGTKAPSIKVELTSNEYGKSGCELYRLAVVRNALEDSPACAVYERKGDEWRRVSGEESGGDKGAPDRLVMEEKKFAIIRQPD